VLLAFSSCRLLLSSVSLTLHQHHQFSASCEDKHNISLKLFFFQLLVIAFFSTTGNLLVCVAVGLNRKLRTVTNYFLVSLAVADICVGAIAIPCAILTDIGLPRHNLYLCLLMLSVLIMFTQSSIFSLLAVAVERYIAIFMPFRYQRSQTFSIFCSQPLHVLRFDLAYSTAKSFSVFSPLAPPFWSPFPTRSKIEHLYLFIAGSVICNKTYIMMSLQMYRYMYRLNLSYVRPTTIEMAVSCFHSND
uniref:G-protein coupled receptors family 1 profile domain-containing protein n=1 Tax=Oreochromis aureus TaxID=47969 RepID=A0AAZ1XFJ2_OREAU